MRRPLCLLALSLACAASLPESIAAGQSKTQGSPLQSPANYSYGCETGWLPGHSGYYEPHHHGTTTCTLIQPGTTTDNSFLVPGDGTVTKARVKVGESPPQISIATLRRYFKPDQNGVMQYTCCFGVSETLPVQPQPNSVVEIPVNFLVDTAQPENGQTGWWDIVAVNVHGAGNLPMSDLGDNPNQASPGMLVAWWQFPKTSPNDNNISDWQATNFETLMQYDWTPCKAPASRSARAAQACGGATTPPPAGGGTTAPPAGGGAPLVPLPQPAASGAQIRSTALTLRRGKVRISVKCTLTTACDGIVRLRTRARRPRLLASKRVAIVAGRTARVTLTLSRANRRRIKPRGTKVVAEVDLGAAGRTTRNLTVKRRR
jgi:hypothetical protein